MMPGGGIEGRPMIEKRSAEDRLAELEDILRRYRLGIARSNTRGSLTHEEALTALRKLGFTVGEALRMLRSRQRS
jgi:Holliday junction resolvasome RuvABC DNA-binding subunit